MNNLIGELRLCVYVSAESCNARFHDELAGLPATDQMVHEAYI